MPPTGDETLARFYTQKLAWSACGPNQCASLTVPIDYSHPDGDTVKLAVLKVEASSPPSGSDHSLVNPGGPGAPATSYAAAADLIVTPKGDPRGIRHRRRRPSRRGGSSPIKCLNDREVDTFMGSDPTPDDKTEEQQFADSAIAFAEKCKANGGPLLAHVSTIETAKDMDILRAALGEPKLDFMGKSYGTFLGATYADLFPTKVGKVRPRRRRGPERHVGAR